MFLSLNPLEKFLRNPSDNLWNFETSLSMFVQTKKEKKKRPSLRA